MASASPSTEEALACDVFISYARPTSAVASATAKALRAAGYDVWFDESLPAHRAFADVIEERLRAARAVLVLWSAPATKSHWVRAEADMGLTGGKLVQYSVDDVVPPMPFNQIHCAMGNGAPDPSRSPAWDGLLASIKALVAGEALPQYSDQAGGRAAKPAAPSKPSIAVMPFANITGDPAQDYFADGMAEEIATALSRIKSIFVIAGSSSRALREANLTPDEAASTLGVRYMLEGSVRVAGGRVRISLGLVDTAAGARIWSERFEDTMVDVFALQDRVALAVAGVIEPAIQVAEIQRALQRPIPQSGSYDLYLRALHLQTSLLEDDMRASFALLEQSLAIDPDNPSALVLAAYYHAQALLVQWGDDPEQHRREGLALVNHALRVAPDDPEIVARALMPLREFGEDVGVVARLAARAVALNPGSALALGASGWMHLLAGRFDLAREQLEASLQLDPISPESTLRMSGLALLKFCEGDYDGAVAQLVDAVRRKPNAIINAVLLTVCYAAKGDLAAAKTALDSFYALSPEGDPVAWLNAIGDPASRQIAIEALARVDRVEPA